jgi:multidrug resistance efflux pump
MDKQFQNIDIYSEQVRDILEKPPKNFLRIGVLGLFIFFSLVLTLSHFVRYPDKLSMQGELIVGQKPIEIFPKISGLIDSLFVEDKSNIAKGEVVLTIQSTLDQEDLARFDSFSKLFKAIEHIPDFLIINSPPELKLGEFTSSYANLNKTFLEFQNFLRDESVNIKIYALENEISQIKKLNNSLNKQSEYYHQDISLTQEDYNRNLRLEKDGVIAPVDREKAESKLLNEKRNLEAFKSNIISNEVRIQQLKTQIAELTAERRNGVNTRIFTISQQIDDLKSKIVEWQDKYFIKAPISGRVAFYQSINSNDFIKASERLITIIPEINNTHTLTIEGLLPIKSSGTLKVGQKAIVNLENYPSNQYGTIHGIVKDISLLPNEDNYQVEIELPEGLKTTYNKEIPIRPSLKANVSINTQEYSLLERIFQSIMDITKNRNQ